jgi:hypothetical protein
MAVRIGGVSRWEEVSEILENIILKQSDKRERNLGAEDIRTRFRRIAGYFQTFLRQFANSANETFEPVFPYSGAIR